MAICGGTTPSLEFAFGVDPLTEPTAGQWVDAVAVDAVRQIEVTRGFKPVRDEIQVGHLHAVFLNSSGDFDPDNTSGAYYPDLKEDVQLRYRSTVGGVTRNRFRGFVASIVPHYPRGRQPYTVVDAYDSLWLAARHNLTTVGFPRKVLTWSPAPSSYWRLGDRDTASTAYDETGNRRFATHGLGSRVGAEGLLTSDDDRATNLAGARVVVGTTDAGLSGTTHGLFMVARVPSIPASSQLLFDHSGAGFNVEMRLLSDGRVRLSAGGSTVETTYAVVAGTPFTAGFRRSGSSWTLGVDNGDGLETVTGSLTASSLTATWPIVGGTRLAPDFVASLNGEVDEVVIWGSSDPGTSMLQDLSNAALRPGYGESGVERFLAIADLFGFPAARLDYEYDGYYEAFGLGAWPSISGTALDAFRRLARTVTADIYSANDGMLRYRGYEFPTGTATPLASFTDLDNSEIPCRSIAPGRRQRNARTRIEVSDGTRRVTIDNTAGQVAHADIDLSVFPGLTDDTPDDVAQRTARELASARSHIEELELQLLALSDTQRGEVLDLDLFSPIQVTVEGRTELGEVTYIKETVTPSSCDVVMAARPLRETYQPAVRAIHSAHTAVDSGSSAEPAIPGEQFDNDVGHAGIVTDTGVALQNDVYHRNEDIYLIFGQTWWAGSTAGSRRLYLRDNVASERIAYVADAGVGNGTGQNVVTLRQAGNPGPGDPVESTALEVVQTSGGSLDLFASALGDANWHFAPVIGQVRIPDDRHAVRAFRSSALSVANNTETTLNFDGTDRFDTGGMHDPASNNHRLTAAKNASFFIGGHLAFAANGTGHRILSIRDQSGNRIARAGTRGTSDGETGLTTATVYKLTAGQWVDFQGYQSSGGALSAITTQRYGMEAWAVELVHSARATMSAAPAAGSISSGNYYTLSWDTERWDDASLFTPTSAYMTAAADGPHVIGCAVEWLGNANGSRRVEIVLNDSIVIARREILPFTTTSTSQDCWTIWPDTRAGDQFSIRVWQDSGDNNLTLFKTSPDPHSPEFWCGLIAAA